MDDKYEYSDIRAESAVVTKPSSELDDESHGLLEDGSHERGRPARRSPRFIALLVMTILNLILLGTSVALLSVWYYNNLLQMNPKLRHVTSWTPLMDRIDLDMQVKRINGSLFQPKDMSVARQKPNKAADAIWHEWEVSRPLVVSSADILRLGKDVTTAVKLDPAVWGLGDDAYVATLDVFHQLHCLNLLRQMIFPDSYYDTRHGHEYPEWREAHLTHCVDILMQSIQCSGNLNLVTMHWVETQEAPWPDFSIDRQCFDFEQLTAWRKENTLDLKRATREIQKPEGVVQRPAPDRLYELNNWTNPNHVDGANPGEDFNF